jgi:hypothetical protein
MNRGYGIAEHARVNCSSDQLLNFEGENKYARGLPRTNKVRAPMAQEQ